MKFKFLKAVLAAAGLFFSIGSAQAIVYSNSHDSSINFFGAPDTTSYGQTFTVGADTNLLNWSFYADSGNAGNLAFVVAGWDGSKAVGPALYASSIFSYTGGAETLAFSNINTFLSAGAYIGYITVANVASPATSVSIGGSNSDGGLAGGFRFLNSNGVDPLTLSESWSSWSASNMQYTAEFGSIPQAVPEPSVLALFGIGLLGLAALRRKSV